jgi:hypothetical protein
MNSNHARRIGRNEGTKKVFPTAEVLKCRASQECAKSRLCSFQEWNPLDHTFDQYQIKQVHRSKTSASQKTKTKNSALIVNDAVVML